MTELRFDRKVFFDRVRHSVFDGGLSQGQVDGLNRLLDVWERYCQDFPQRHLAYNLATSFWETGRTHQPITERGARSYFNKYEPGTRLGKTLGNTQPGDGYRYRGEGDVQNTGRRNARVSSDRLNAKFGFNVDFEANPSQRGDPLYSALCLFLGNEEGWWTGKKLSDYKTFYSMRKVVNGTDKAKTIAGIAEHFERAVNASARRVEADQELPTTPQTGVQKMSFLRAFLPIGISLLKGLFPGQATGEKPENKMVGILRGILGMFGADKVADDSGAYGWLGNLIPQLTDGGQGLGNLLSGGNNSTLLLALFIFQMIMGNVSQQPVSPSSSEGSASEPGTSK